MGRAVFAGRNNGTEITYTNVLSRRSVVPSLSPCASLPVNIPIDRSLRIFLLVGWALGLHPLAAQEGRGSLTEAFPDMSAKERSRMAAKETQEAASDQAYQQVMKEAETAFQEKRYQDALQAYERAREMRPYNVYPKVKIEDLRALVAREQAPEPSAVPRSAAMVETPVVEAPAPTPPASPITAPVEAGRRDAPERPGTEEVVEERQYHEGAAFVVERIVRTTGGTMEYKRVVHPSGHTFYFLDGRSVSERIWKERFPRF